jgi:NAD(P)-dependent dehydrogenase (short-subunit alcohol dehydrogenase family)
MALLEKHIAVVTGAGSGIGRAIAAGYAREGARVVVLDVNGTAAVQTAKEIREAGGNAESFALDVAKRDDCTAMAKQIAGQGRAGLYPRHRMPASRAATACWARRSAVGSDDFRRTSSRSTSRACST